MIPRIQQGWLERHRTSGRAGNGGDQLANDPYPEGEEIFPHTGATTYTLETAYDTADRPVYSIYPNGIQATTAYDGEFPQTLSVTGHNTVISDLNYNPRGQLVAVYRAGGPNSTLSYHNQTKNFALSQIQHGVVGSTFPNFGYTAYDAVGNLTGMTISGVARTFTYDGANRLTGVSGAYSHTYAYDPMGNFDYVVRNGVTWDYQYATYNPSRLERVTGLDFEIDDADGYDGRGNLKTYTQSNVDYVLSYGVQGWLTSAQVAGQTTTFLYDDSGQRVRTIYQSGTSQATTVYTLFPDYELEDPPGTGANTIRITHRLAGQIAAVQKLSGTTDELFYALTDHLGSIVALATKGGTQPVAGSVAAYEPFGAFLTTPTTNTGTSDNGFTGHRHNNTGANDLGLIYMNARYYHPQLGRFVSPDSIVPEPGNPQSYNRYSYSYNDPVNYTDPSGHCAGNPDGVGNSFDENLCWSNVATIGNLWEHTDYWKDRWGNYEDFVLNVGSNPLLGTNFFSDELLRYTQSDQYKAWSAQLASSYPPSPPPVDTGEYWVLSITFPLPLPFPLGFKVIRDDWGIWYFNIHEASAAGFSVMRGQIFVNDTGKPLDAIPITDFPLELQADLTKSALPGVSGGGSAGWYFVGGSINVASGPKAHVYTEGGLYRPGYSNELGFTFIAPWLK